MDLRDKINAKLKEQGYKLTPQRRAVLDAIIESIGLHLSTEEIYDLVKANVPEIGLATVYRTVMLFDELGLLSKLNLDDGCVRYEINEHEDDHQHHHLICTNCGKILEVKEDLLDGLEAKIEKAYDFDIKDHKLKFYGFCSECKTAKA